MPIPPSICPQCVVKYAATDVPNYPEFALGYKVVSATLHALVRYDESEVEGDATWIQQGRRPLTEVRGPGHFEDLKLPMRTADSPHALSIELVLASSTGAPELRKTVGAHLMDPQPVHGALTAVSGS